MTGIMRKGPLSFDITISEEDIKVRELAKIWHIKTERNFVDCICSATLVHIHCLN